MTREEIIERIWGRSVFLDTNNAINTAVRKIRRALRDDPAAPRFVVTVPGQGLPLRCADAASRSPDLRGRAPPAKAQSGRR